MADLERDIFGGSDSELSSDEGENVQQSRKIEPKYSGAGDEYESSVAESADEYNERGSASKRRKKRLSKRDEDEDGRPIARKRKRKPPPAEVDLNDLPPAQASKLRMEMQIDAILKPKKANRHKKRKKDADEEVLDRFADEEVSRLREAMTEAAKADDIANRAKLPATNKLRLLPEVIEVLRKAALAQSIVDNNLLEGVRRWLEPLPDHSLPTLNIQRDFFPILKRMEFIDSAVLKESGLGRVVLFYTKCKRVTPEIARIANDLVSTWSRPIIKRSASYRDRVVELDNSNDSGGIVGPRAGEKLNAILARAREGEKHRVRKNAVAIPQRELGTYLVAPKMNAGVRSNISVDVDIERRRNNAQRLRNLTRKVANKA